MFSYTGHSNLGTVKETVFTVITALPMLLQVMQMVMVMPLQSHGEWSGDILRWQRVQRGRSSHNHLQDRAITIEYSGDALLTAGLICPSSTQKRTVKPQSVVS